MVDTEDVWRSSCSTAQWAAAKKEEELTSANPCRNRGAACDANQEATWCERGQINAAELTVTQDRCFLNDTHPTHTHTHLHTILGLLLIPSLSCVRGFPRHPAHAHTHIHKHTHASSDRRGGVGRQAGQGGRRTGHAHRQTWQQAGNSREQPRLFSLLFQWVQFPFWSKQVGEKKHLQAGGGSKIPKNINRSTMKTSNKPVRKH